jgi:hypothetical protein
VKTVQLRDRAINLGHVEMIEKIGVCAFYELAEKGIAFLGHHK